jgi:peptide/nickel transport system substrate-binding protein
MLKTTIKRLLVLALTAAMLFTAAGCSTDPKKIIWGIEEEQVTYKYDKTIYLGVEKFRNLNPLISKDESVYYISKLTFDSLFKLDEQLVPQPVLAGSMTYDEKGTELTITLRKDVTFHDGKKLTGEDVKFTIEAIKALAKTGETIYSSHVANIKSVSVPKSDPYTVIISYVSTYGNGYENLIFPILPAHQFKSASAVKAAGKDYKMIGTGAYRQSDYFELSSLVLTPYEDYFGARAESTLKFQILPDISFATSMTDSGDISLFFDDVINKDSILSRYELDVSAYLSNKPEVLGFNCISPVLSNQKARQAVAFAVDASEILEKAYYKSGVLADSLYYPDFYGVGNAGDAYERNVSKAERLLAQANCTGAALNLIVQSSEPTRVKAADIIAGNLAEAGLTVNIIPCTDAEFNERLYLKNYDLFIGGFSIDERYDLKNLLHSGYGNVAGFSDPDVDALLTEMTIGAEQFTKGEKVAKLKAILNDRLPYYTLLYRTDGCYKSAYFDGIAAPMFNDIYRGCKNWQCKYPETILEEK